jgi:hypothetical protein
VSALDHARGKILAAAGNGRNSTLYGQARWCFEIAAGGGIKFTEVWEHLSQAGREVGLDSVEIKSTLRSAEREGRRNPRGSRKQGNAEPAPPPPPEPPKYPPTEAVQGLIDASTTLLSDPESCDWLERSRGLDPTLVHRLGRVRVTLPVHEVSEETAAIIPKRTVDGKRYLLPTIGYRLVFPLVNPTGELRSALFRRCIDTDDPNMPKSMGLFGARRRLVMANRAALALLRRDKGRARWWGDRPLEVVIAEGEMDYLQACIEPTGSMRAVLGIFTGSWCESYARLIPPEAKLIIAVDGDDEDDKLTQQILRTMKGRSCLRWKPKVEGHDLNDAGGIRGGHCYEAR